MRRASDDDTADRMVSTGVDLRLISDQADAVLAILAKRVAGRSPVDADWERLFASEGHARLKRREQAMATPLEDEGFRDFVLSRDLLERAAALEETLSRWRQADLGEAARRALVYLPADARICGRVYPVIKPRTNSFVHDVQTDPALFLYLDPAKSEPQFLNLLAHEFHHIGHASSCPAEQAAAEIAALPLGVRLILDCLTAFGEGIAMLAAAGGADVHPHAESAPEDRARWDRDAADFDQDLREIEVFLRDVLEGRLATEEEVWRVGFSFFGLQGPWYTVGWKMAATIERVCGREELIDCLRDPRRLLPTYNAAAAEWGLSSGEPLALWSAALVDGLW